VQQFQLIHQVSSLEITVKELKEKHIDIENSTQVMSVLFEDVKHNCSSNKTEIDTLKRRFEEVPVYISKLYVLYS
jgi:hypothetical protein